MGNLLYNADTYNIKLKNAGIKYYIIGEFNGVLKDTDFYCEEHDYVFTARPNSVFYKNTSCPICTGNVIQHTKETYNKKLKDRGIPWYIVGEYITCKIETIFYCEEHGEFEAIPRDILTGNKGCPKCPKNKGGRKPNTKENFNLMLKEREIKYVLVGDYITNDTETDFYCEEHDHVFTAIPNNVLMGQKQCPICSGFVRYTKESYNDALKNNGIKYVLVGEFKSTNDDSEFYCDEHDHIFIGNPSSVLGGHKQCPICSGLISWDTNKYTTFLKENNKKLKILGEFISVDTKIKTQCECCNHIWDANPASIIYRNTGCPICAKFGFDPTKPAIYYYIKLKDYELYKGGITNNTVKKRFPGDYKLMEELFIIPFELGKDAHEFEQHILKEFREYKYTGQNILKSGNTEIFTRNILEDLVKYL